ncbi:MAG: hypothetical protein K6D38_09355 [Pseudobutyrivibrio sp.]|nr:hypothetical protein [Pseudobutyrivibrio sp.]
MPDEFKGPHIFKHRYIGLSEEDIRGEIERLQGELYAMQDTLEYFGKDNKQIREQIAQSQEANEKLLRGLETKVQNLQDALDYSAPIKAQIDTATKEFTEKMDAALNTERMKKQEKAIGTITRLVVFDTILLLAAVGLLGYTILFI